MARDQEAGPFENQLSFVLEDAALLISTGFENITLQAAQEQASDRVHSMGLNVPTD